jgi:ketosteroid isomerase-like protein
MDRMQWIETLFQHVDSKDLKSFGELLCEDVLFRFGNAEPVTGRDAVRELLHGFLHSIQGLRHEVAAYWEIEDTVFFHGFVSYTRHDASVLRVPFANLFRLRDGLIREYLIFIDGSELYAKD